ncbi:MAG TPA: pseudouridine synthase [Longimicrobiales bacterium]|nr:pseudouridine synthase [Longimicrobiales bacterium]
MSAERGVRLQKFLSQAGVASRRQGEEMIVQGRVRVNGKVVTELGVRVYPTRDRVQVDGERVRPALEEWYALHKPRGYLSTRSDPQGRPTLYELLPPPMRRLFYVGRLDYDSEGLILLTNDGDTAHRLLHPRYGIERDYEVELDEPIESDALAQLRRGVELEDGPARAESIRRRSGTVIIVTLREGRKREVRRMFEAVGKRVCRLRRVRYGPIKLGTLKSGEWRHLEEREVAALQRAPRAPDDHVETTGG